MDRVTVYSGEIPRTVDFLQAEQNTMVSIGKIASMMLGAIQCVNGFNCAPTLPASLSVALAGGELYQTESLEATTWSSLSADTTDQIVKQGIQLASQNIGITPPGTAGFSQVFLIEVQYLDNDTGSTVLPYFNAANPSTPLSGPGGSGTPQNTTRKGSVQVQTKAGIAATTGTQVAPTQDAGWIGLWLITVSQGQTTITAGNIVPYPNAPVISLKLPSVPAYIQAATAVYFVDTGTANVYAIAPVPAPVSITAGTTYKIKIGNTNTIASTLGVTLSNGTVQTNSIIHGDGTSTIGGDFIAGQVVELTFDGSNWQMPRAGTVIQQATTITASATLNVSTGQYAFGFNRTVAPAAMVVNLPSGAAVGQEFVFEDLALNFNSAIPTLTPPGGHTIRGQANYQMNVDGGSYRVRYYGSNIWGLSIA